MFNPLDLFSCSVHLELQQVFIDRRAVGFVVHATEPVACCPSCGDMSAKVHSRYRRCLAGLPWNGCRLRLEVLVRRFVCQAPECPRRIFAEQLPDLAAPYARSTTDLHQTHTQIGVAAGGEGGSRLATRLAMPTSPDTLLRRVRQAALQPGSPVRVLGVDDFAFRKGHRYGTILVDLEKRRPIDLLPERSAEALCAWLQQHPEVEIISRDRGDDMIRGATAGAPQATQVADRWHLLQNLKDALKGTVDRHHADVKDAAREAATQSKVETPATVQSPPSELAGAVAASSAKATESKSSDATEARREQRVERYEQVQALHRQGVSQREIARRLGMHRDTAARLLAADTLPQRAVRQYRRRSDRFVEHLRRRWSEGCHNAALLFEELKQQGYHGSYYSVRRQVAQWRSAADRHWTATGTQPVRPILLERPSARRVTWILLKDDSDLEQHEQTFRDRLSERSASLGDAAELARQFRNIVRQQKADALDPWLARATAPTAAKELRSLADGLKKDEPAVRAALELDWSNGQVEGQVNRLKMIKREMFGRANFDLLRKGTTKSKWQILVSSKWLVFKRPSLAGFEVLPHF